jgi:hypothetical protein
VLATSLGGRDPLTSLRKGCASLFVSQSTAESGINSWIFIMIYFLAMRIVFSYEKRRIAEFVKEMAEAAHYHHISRARMLHPVH